MKVVLINPPLDRINNYGSLTDLAPELPPLGLAFVSAYLKKCNVDVTFYDMSCKRFEDVEEVAIGADIVGFTSFITNYDIVKELSRELKAIKSNLFIVVGGPHATLFPEDFFDSKIDYICRGEGEMAMEKLIASLKENVKTINIDGIIDNNDESKFSKINTRGAEVLSLDSIGKPDLSNLILGQYLPPVHILGRKVIHTLTSRGCPFSCKFCAAAEVMGRKMRFRSIDSIIEELTEYKNAGYDSIMFYDDIFTVNNDRVISLCRKMIERKLHLKWSCFTRSNVAKNCEMLNLMRKAGCYLITFGFESANPKTLDLIQKDLTLEDNRVALSLCSAVGIRTCSSFMIGLPGERREDILKTIDYARDTSLTFAVFPIFEPFKGTPIFEICKNMGKFVELGGVKNSLLKNQDEVWLPEGFSREEIVSLSRTAFKRFYLKPFRILSIFCHSLRLPLKRAFKFIKGGLSYFLSLSKSYDSKFNTHY